MSLYGYIRVSSRDQNEARQINDMKKVNVPEKNIYIDKQSGKDFKRAAYKKLLRKLKEGDILYIKSIDRFGRNYKEINEQWRIITKVKKADIIVLDMPLLDTTYSKDLLGTFLSDVVLQIFSFVAETGRNTIRANQRDGIKAAMAKGVKFGRPRVMSQKKFEESYMMYKNQNLMPAEIKEKMGLSTTTFYRYKQIMKENERGKNYEEIRAN